MIDMDKAIRKALSPTECPSDILNERILSQFDMKKAEGEKIRMKKLRFAASVAVVTFLFVIPVSAYAAFKYLLPKEVARKNGR